MRDVDISRVVYIDYTNWRGERGLRKIVPQRIEHKSSQWHPTPQFVLVAWDVDRQQERDFAFSGIHGWQHPGEEIDTWEAKVWPQPGVPMGAAEVSRLLEVNAAQALAIEKLGGLVRDMIKEFRRELTYGEALVAADDFESVYSKLRKKYLP